VISECFIFYMNCCTLVKTMRLLAVLVEGQGCLGFDISTSQVGQLLLTLTKSTSIYGANLINTGYKNQQLQEPQ
jgi:hypothetical protein